MSSYRRRRQKSRTGSTRGLIIITVVVGAICALYAVRFMVESSRVEIDRESGCPQAGSPEYVAVVFDKTDGYNRIQKQYLHRYFEQFKNSLRVGARVALFVIRSSSETSIRPEIVICNPGDGQAASYWTANPRMLKKRWVDQFERPLETAIDEFMRPAEATSSPIMEMLQIVALSAFPPGTEAASKRMILVSDMLHHTAEWSHYRKQMNFEELKNSGYYRKVRTDLHGTEVQILYVRRDGADHLQTRRHAFFWADYIHSVNAKLSLVENIEG